VVPAGAALTGSGALSATVLGQQNAAANLTGVGSLSATPVQQYNAGMGFTGAGNLVAAVIQQYRDTTALSGSGALSSLAYAIEPDAALLTGSGALTSSASAIVPASLGLTGSGVLSVAAVLGSYSAVNLQGVGALTSTVIQQFQNTATLTGSGVLTSAAVQQFQDTPALSGSGSLAEAAPSYAIVPVSAALTGSGALSATATAIQPPAYDATGAGSSNVSAGSISWSHTVTAAGNAIVVGALCGSGGGTVPTITAKVGTTAMTVLATYTSSTGTKTGGRLFGLTGVAPGTYTITVTCNITASLIGNSVSLANVSSFGTGVNTTTATGSSLSQTVSAATGQLIVQMFVTDSTSIGSYNQTTIYSKDINTLGFYYGEQFGYAAGASSVTFTATTGNSSQWGAVAVPVH
jgi:hypothetical protein